MTFKSVSLRNVGCYGASAFVPFRSVPDKNIVLVGGRNGAGKTTLFYAVKLCLYGREGMGYDFFASQYKAYVRSLRSKQFPTSGMEIDVSLEIGGEDYAVSRSWDFGRGNAFSEDFAVVKGGEPISADDFSLWLCGQVPPALLDLFFFDGEKVGDRLLDGDGLRDAFLTLCGLDGLQSLRRQFARRRGSSQEPSEAVVSRYLDAKRGLGDARSRLAQAESRAEAARRSVDDAEAKIAALDRDYFKRGGVSKREWDALQSRMREEERLRDGLNAESRRLFHSELPFLVCRGRLEELDRLLSSDRVSRCSDELAEWLAHALPSVIHGVWGVDGDTDARARSVMAKLERGLLDALPKAGELPFSFTASQHQELCALLKRALSFIPQDVLSVRDAVGESRERTRQIRAELSDVSVDFLDRYEEERQVLLSRRDACQADLDSAVGLMEQLRLDADGAEAEFAGAEQALDDALKANSILDLASRGVLFCDELVDRITESKREAFCRVLLDTFNRLTFKERLIGKAELGPDFRLAVYRVDSDCEPVPMELSSFSAGERQILAMSAYRALAFVSPAEVPFVIDTPFARVDSVHRKLIAERFFRELGGQRVIFSTDEEFAGSVLDAVRDKVGSSVLLKNKGLVTEVREGEYFERI